MLRHRSVAMLNLFLVHLGEAAVGQAGQEPDIERSPPPGRPRGAGGCDQRHGSHRQRVCIINVRTPDDLHRRRKGARSPTLLYELDVEGGEIG